MIDVPNITLNDGLSMPQLGFGVYQVKDGNEVEEAVVAAIESGYRLIDTAALYGNEEGVGRAIKKSGVPREELFITTKLWNTDQGHESALAAFETSLHKLQLDYVDLYLIHWPSPKRGLFVETWKALELIQTQGKVRSIGVSNFHQEHLKQLLNETNVVPAVNQIELHPHLPQTDVSQFCTDHDIIVQAWSPIGGSGGGLLDEPILGDIGKKYCKSPAQVVLRWHMQKGHGAIPKSVTPSRIQQNIDVFNFELTQDEMSQIDALENGNRVGPNPDTADF